MYLFKQLSKFLFLIIISTAFIFSDDSVYEFNNCDQGGRTGPSQFIEISL